MGLWHWFRVVFGLFEFVSLMVAAPVSLVFGWIAWLRTDRHASTREWRGKVLFSGLIAATLAAVLFFATLAEMRLTRDHGTAAQTALVNAICLTGAICCMAGMLASVFGKGRSRASVAATGIFGLFVFASITPFAVLP